ncbi:ABC transporter permease [Candidatus Woesearchaeota archaeon]|nr:ABC transporter permease [Candidatus Woesearchaeota archaeon]
MAIKDILKKNFKILTRSKSSGLVIILGPLLVILLVGLAFNTSSTSKLNIGVYIPEKTELTGTFTDVLNESGFGVIEYGQQEECIIDLKQSAVHLCMVFPENFVIESNSSNEILFYVDKSRTNFVYTIINTVSSKVQLQSSELSYELTNAVINALNNARDINSENMIKVIKMKEDLSSSMEGIESVLGDLNDLDLTQESVGTILVLNYAKNIYDYAKDMEEVMEEVNCDSIGDNETKELCKDIQDEIDNSTLTKDYANFTGSLNTLEQNLNLIKTKLSLAEAAKKSSVSELETLKGKVNSMLLSIDLIKTETEKVNSEIESLKVKEAKKIVSPITTKIEPVSSQTAYINYLFPYFIILIIMFVSILLSSNIIVMEKNSRAFFRNFTTPTTNFKFFGSTFLTNFLLVMTQVIIILGIVYFLLEMNWIANWYIVLILIILTITLFTSIGMIIGYLCSSQETALMISLGTSSIFLLLSNLVMPLERMASFIQNAAHYNPYVMASELLKKGMLFSLHIKQIYFDLLILLAIAFTFFILAYLLSVISKKQYFTGFKALKHISNGKEKNKIFELSGKNIENIDDMIDEINKSSKKEFDDFVEDDFSEFSLWARDIYKNKRLCKMLTGVKDKEKIIRILEEFREIDGKKRKK